MRWLYPPERDQIGKVWDTTPTTDVTRSRTCRSSTWRPATRSDRGDVVDDEHRKALWTVGPRKSGRWSLCPALHGRVRPRTRRAEHPEGPGSHTGLIGNDLRGWNSNATPVLMRVTATSSKSGAAASRRTTVAVQSVLVPVTSTSRCG